MATINDIKRRLESIEATHTTAATGDLRHQILEARRNAPAPTHSHGELKAMATGSSVTARIARGWLRIGHYTTQAARKAPPVIDPDQVLPAMAGFLYNNPLAFTLFAFDFGEDRSLCVVKLPAPWSLAFDSEFGIEQWACEMFDEIGQQVRERAFDGANAVDAIRHATSSGHGVSKSATTAILINWLMTTRPNARGIVTANTAPQLESKTWSELAKWTKRSLFSHWYNVSTGRGSMKMMHKDAPESWNCFGQTSREENSEAMAGLHAADSTPFYVFDEASAIPAAIWHVAEGGLTDGEPHFYAFGNPTRTGTKFHECFHGQRHRWSTHRVDSRTCQLTNKSQLEQWGLDYGLGSDFFKVRVLGEFPSQSSLQFIGRDLVRDAMTRATPSARGETIVLGCDIARFGDDSSVLFTRQGRDARTWPPIKLKGADTMQVASRIAEQVNFFRTAGHHVLVAIDGGGVGGGVIDRLRSLGYEIEEVQFGARALDPRKYAQRRSELWGLLKEYLKVGALPDGTELLDDLTGPEYGFNSVEAIQLEKKSDMKARGLSSPDIADALAITMAVTPPLPGEDDLPHGAYDERARLATLDFNPYIRMK